MVSSLLTFFFFFASYLYFTFISLGHFSGSFLVLYSFFFLSSFFTFFILGSACLILFLHFFSTFSRSFFFFLHFFFFSFFLGYFYLRSREHIRHENQRPEPRKSCQEQTDR